MTKEKRSINPDNFTHRFPLVNDQDLKFHSEVYPIALNNLMNVEYRNLSATFNPIINHFTDKLNSPYQQIDVTKEVKTVVYHVAKAWREGNTAMVLTLNNQVLEQYNLSPKKWRLVLDYMYNNGYINIYIGGRPKKEPEPSKGFSKKAGIKKVTCYKSVLQYTEKFEELFTGKPRDKAPKREKLSPKDYIKVFEWVVNELIAGAKTEKIKFRSEVAPKSIRNENLAPYKNEMKVYNNYLEQQDIRTASGERLVFEYYRIFYNNYQGQGRYYCAHSSLKGAARRLMTINGENVVEHDFDSNFARIVYTLEGITLPPDFKPYQWEGYEKLVPQFNDEKVIRAIFKGGLLICFTSARNDVNTIDGGFKRYLNQLGITIPKAQRIGIIKGIQKHNDKIKRWFGGDNANTLLNYDARLATYTIQTLISEGCPVLCWHDSFIVPESFSERLVEVMHEAYTKVLGGDFNCIVSRKVDKKTEQDYFDDLPDIHNIEQELLEQFDPEEF